jgi:phospholipid/cholesterol/gamma-HCH transport system substrate-binding protein
VNKEAPGIGRVLVIAGFALSCFGLLLFLWLAFGGPIPLKPQGYRIQMAFKDAATLAEQAEVRVAGVTIGRVVGKELAPEGNLSLATVEIDARFAPIRSDARAMLRQKTLLGETYIELTTGSRTAAPLEEGSRLRDTSVQPVVLFDDLLRTFDPDTREAFQQWQQVTAEAIGGQGRDLSDAIGSLAPFVSDAQDIVDVLNRRRSELRGLVRGTGDTFEAITRNEDALRTLIVRQRDVFEELSNRREALADTFQVFPTFLRESRATIRRVTAFSRRTDPLLVELEPVLGDTQATLASLRRAAPSLQALFGDLPALIRAADTGVPPLVRVLRGLDPTLEAAGPFLQQINPILQFLEVYQAWVSDFINVGPSALNIKVAPPPGQSKTNGHALPQVIVEGSQSLAAETRTPDNRGNAYLAPDALVDIRLKDPSRFILPNWDCAHAGGPGGKPPTDTPGCFVQDPIPFLGESRRFPHVQEGARGGTTRGGG